MDESLERTLWAAARALEERAALAHRVSMQASREGHERVSQEFEERAETALGHVNRIREILSHEGALGMDDGEQVGAPPE